MTERVLTLRELKPRHPGAPVPPGSHRPAPIGVIHRLIALQGQLSNAPYVGLLDPSSFLSPCRTDRAPDAQSGWCAPPRCAARCIS